MMTFCPELWSVNLNCETKNDFFCCCLTNTNLSNRNRTLTGNTEKDEVSTLILTKYSLSGRIFSHSSTEVTH